MQIHDDIQKNKRLNPSKELAKNDYDVEDMKKQ